MTVFGELSLSGTLFQPINPLLYILYPAQVQKGVRMALVGAWYQDQPTTAPYTSSAIPTDRES